MKPYIQKNMTLLLLIGIILLTIFRILIPFISGFSGFFYDIFLLCTEVVRYVLIVIYVIIIIISIRNQNHRLSLPVFLLFLFLVGLVPTGHFMTLGALFSIHTASPEEFRYDARVIIDEYKPMACFIDTVRRVPCNNPFPRNLIPYSIRRVNIGDVLVLEDYILIEKFGLLELFRGFVVFQKGLDIWENEKPITLQNGCSTCWKIRIIDGLYWYHAEPMGNEIPSFTIPLN